jgi:hypothetical protein
MRLPAWNRSACFVLWAPGCCHFHWSGVACVCVREPILGEALGGRGFKDGVITSDDSCRPAGVEWVVPARKAIWSSYFYE